MSLAVFAPFCSTEIRFLHPDELQQHILSLKLSDVVLVMSRGGASRWQLDILISQLREQSSSFVWVDAVPSNPEAKDIHAALQKIGSSRVTTILAIGGGSCIDLAKGISAFYSPAAIPSADAILQSIREKSYALHRGLAILAVPTTAGTGSEVTQWATVWDMGQKEKLSLDCPQLKPAAAYIVPEFTLSLSAELTLSTGLDALCHAVEAYWSKHTTPLVQDIAYRAIAIIISDLRRVLEQPADIVLRERMCRASLLAGLAFSQTRTTACHAISYPLTMYYGIPHGFAAALTLAGVAELNRGHFPNDGELFGLFSEYGGIQSWLDMVCKGIVELRANAFGVEDLKMIAEKACGNGRMGNNPVKYDKMMITKIFEKTDGEY